MQICKKNTIVGLELCLFIVQMYKNRLDGHNSSRKSNQGRPKMLHMDNAETEPRKREWSILFNNTYNCQNISTDNIQFNSLLNLLWYLRKWKFKNKKV